MEKRVIDFFEKELNKERTLKYISEKLQLTELEILGYVYKLKDQGINIDYYEKDDEAYLVRNDHPDLSKENVYRIEVKEHKTKIAFIADIRAGSKYEQFEILNDLYLKFLKEGITKVFILGNLVEGKYSGKTFNEFGKSLISNDAKGQVEHLIEYFPEIEGIETFFITGELDHSWSSKLNVGEHLAKERTDLKYLGPRSCTIYLNNVCFRLEQLKKANAYTVAYPPQKYSRSMSSTEKYDAIFLSGGLNFQHFPEINKTQIFSLASLVNRTPKMASDNQNNTMGALLVEIEYTKSGKLKHLIPMIMPYHKPSKENYLNIKRLTIKNENIISNNENDKQEKYNHTLDKLYNAMKKEEDFHSLALRLELSDNELYGALNLLKQRGYPINLRSCDSELLVEKSFQRRRNKEIKPPMEELNKKEIGVVSDTHYGSIYSQPSMVNTFVYEAYNRGITDIFHAGDITDGDYSRIRPNHVHEVFLYGATGQLDYTIATLPKYKGIKWHAICGSHDQTHLFNYGMDLGKEIEKRRKDFEYLGQDRAFYMLDKCRIELFHPGGGTSRILSTKPQNGLDQMTANERIDLSLRGHYHKVYYMFYHGTHVCLLPCNVDQSSFMMKNEIPNLMGNYFLTLYYDEKGIIHYLVPEPMMFTVSDVRKNDYMNPKRNLPHKILTKK